MKSGEALAVLAGVTLLVLMPSNSHAAWCANYHNGGTNCGFSSFQSCQAAVSGVGGSCTQLVDGSEAPRKRTVRESEQRKVRQAAPKPPRALKEKSTAKPIPPSQPSATAQPTPSAPVPADIKPIRGGPQRAAAFAKGRQLVLSGQYEAGINTLRALQFDDHPDVAAFLGLANRKLGRIDDARRWYERALAADPNHKLAISFYGILRVETGDLVRAQADLDRLKQICGETSCNEHQALAAVIATSRR